MSRYVTVIAPTIGLALTIVNAAGPRLLAGYVAIAAATLAAEIVKVLTTKEHP